MKRKIAFSKTCRNKVKFPNKEQAEKRAQEIGSKGVKLHVYQCNACQGWHLTRRTEEQRKEIRKIVSKIQKKHNKQYKNQLEREVDYWLRKKGW